MKNQEQNSQLKEKLGRMLWGLLPLALFIFIFILTAPSFFEVKVENNILSFFGGFLVALVYATLVSAIVLDPSKLKQEE